MEIEELWRPKKNLDNGILEWGNIGKLGLRGYNPIFKFALNPPGPNQNNFNRYPQYPLFYYSFLPIFHLGRSPLLPGDKLVKLGKHLIDFNPVLKIPGGTDVGPFVHHYPAHMGGTVFAARTVSGFRRAAAVHGIKI